MAEHKLSLSASREARQKKDSSEATRAKSKATRATKPVDDEEDDEEDDDILSGIPERGKNKNNMLFIVAGIAVVVVVVFVFIIFFMGGRNEPAQQETTQPQQTTQQQATQQPVEETLPEGVGTQDFTQNTTMTNSDVLTNPVQYTQDIYGLTTRVDYTVNRISNVADFVSYTKHRGTWGGGLELYWLEAEYHGSKYVIQVPFEYYKELDDTGIVPVKMEVLTIAGTTADETLTVISYMCLDEETLESVLKSQSK